MGAELMAAHGAVALWQHWCGLWKGGGGSCGRENKVQWVAEGG